MTLLFNGGHINLRFFKIFFAFITLLSAIYLVGFTMGGNVYDDVVRLHIIADSNSEEDQNIKLSVRDMVLEKYSAALSNCEDREKALIAAYELLPKIEMDVNEYLRDFTDYSCKVTLEESYFPTKNYGKYSLPCGNYTALCIRLGKAVGENYWCVLFPPLCLSASGKDERELFISCGLSEDEYNLMLTEKPRYKLKFKILELLAKE